LNAEIVQELTDQGADLVGFADVTCLPGSVTDGLPRAVSIAVALDPAVIREIEDGPTARYFAEYRRANVLLGRLGEQTARLLADAGYGARAFPATTEQIDRTTLSVKLQHRTVATRAGLGWIGKSGLLITKAYGAAVRLASVLTDAELPAAAPTDTSNCGDCCHCVERCPAGAVTGRNWQAGMPREHLYDAAACFRTARDFMGRTGITATICGICINVCPWTQRYLAHETKNLEQAGSNGWQEQRPFGAFRGIGVGSSCGEPDAQRPFGPGPPLCRADIPSASSGQALPADRGRDAFSTKERGQDGLGTQGQDALATKEPSPRPTGLEAATRERPVSHTPSEAQVMPATPADLDAVRRLFREYEASLPFDLSFQNFEEELKELPGRYAPPSGRLLLARWDGAPVGCVALRQIDADTCEMKRLFVQPAFRGTGIGRALAQAIVEEGRRIGYKRMRLDTVCEPAKGLYRSLDFREIPPYQQVPVEGVVFMELEL
jgi:epoxyqueuosine reductase QueG/GNAT superfamily N-acetyltransferase